MTSSIRKPLDMRPSNQLTTWYIFLLFRAAQRLLLPVFSLFNPGWLTLLLVIQRQDQTKQVYWNFEWPSNSLLFSWQSNRPFQSAKLQFSRFVYATTCVSCLVHSRNHRNGHVRMGLKQFWAKKRLTLQSVSCRLVNKYSYLIGGIANSPKKVEK